jgi:flagellar biosynthesis protein FlhF
LAVAGTTPEGARELERLRTEARGRLRIRRNPTGRPRAPGTEDVERVMRATGASQVLIDRVSEAVAGRLPEGAHPLDLAAEELGLVFPVARARRTPGTTSVFAFVGHTGVGKTTSLAKLGARFVRAGKRVALATIDAGSVGAVERLRAYGEILRAPVLALRDAPQLALELDFLAGIDVVLLDTTGDLARDTREIGELREVLSRAQARVAVETYLVLSAVGSLAALDGVTGATRDLQPAGCVITKLDETPVPTPALEHAMHARLPIAFLSDGPDLARNFHRATADTFADLILRGKIS